MFFKIFHKMCFLKYLPFQKKPIRPFLSNSSGEKKASIASIDDMFQSSSNSLRDFDKIFSINSFFLTHSQRDLAFLLILQLIMCLFLIHLYIHSLFIEHSLFSTIIKSSIFTVFSVFLIAFNLYILHWKQEISAKKLQKYINFLTILSLIFLMLFDPISPVHWISFQTDCSFIPALSKAHLLLFLLYVNLLKVFSHQIFIIVFRLISKILETLLSVDILSESHYSEIAFELLFFLILLLVIFFKKKNQADLIKAINHFKENKEIWTKILNTIPMNVAILQEENPYKILYTNQIFLELFELEGVEDKLYFQSVNTKLDFLTKITDYNQINHLDLFRNESFDKQKKEKLAGNFMNLLEKIHKKEMICDEEEYFLFYCYMAKEKNQNKRKFQIKLKEMKIDDTLMILMVVEDISSLDLICTLKQNNEFKLKLLSSFSHELKTPLNGSIPLLELVVKDEILNEKSNFLINCSIQSLKILENVLNDFIDYAQILSKQLILQIKDFSLSELLSEVSSMVLEQIKQKGLQFIVERDIAIPDFIKTDQARLKQILLSLLLNSLKFTESGSIKLKVFFEKTTNLLSNSIRFEIEDTGTGMPAKKLHFINDCLQNKSLLKMQLDPRGSFLGLLISHKLACKLGNSNNKKGIQIQSVQDKGTIVTFLIENKLNIRKNTTFADFSHKNFDDMKNENLQNINLLQNKGSSPFQNFTKLTLISSKRSLSDNQISSYEVFIEPGTLLLNSSKTNKSLLLNTFEKTLKISKKTKEILYNSKKTQETASEEKKPFSSDISPILSQKEILCVDDDSFNLLTLELMLKKYNRRCLKAFNGKQAIELILKREEDKRPFGLVLMDYAMPILDGVETTKKLKDLMREKQISAFPIIGCSAFNSKNEMEKCFEAGMCGFLEKPIKIKELENVINDYLN